MPWATLAHQSILKLSSALTQPLQASLIGQITASKTVLVELNVYTLPSET